MKFKPGDLVRYGDLRGARTVSSAPLALVLKVLAASYTTPVQRVLIQWFKTGVRTWEYTDLFEKASK
tara:strand:+ start:464 stop:664 length:201 start_codon:yes stop_codon:yes gene_type:complete